MSLLLAAALAVAPAALPACSWDRPGANPFVGDVIEAVDRYTDIPPAVRKALKARMVARQYDEIASISRDSITGQQRYRPEIRDMHFGNGTVCKTVSRKKWPEAAVERGLVYCESGHCLIVPTVCRNLSRVARLPALAAAADDGAAPLLASAGGAAGQGELQFDSPGAGDSFARRASATAPAEVSSGTTPGTTPGITPGNGGTTDGGTLVPGPSPFIPGGGGRGGGIGGGGGNIVLPPTPPVPEPASWVLMLLGALAVFGAARRRRR